MFLIYKFKKFSPPAIGALPQTPLGAPALRPPAERDLGPSPNGVWGSAPAGSWGGAPSYIVAGWWVGCGPRLCSAHPRTVRARYASPQPTHHNWIQTNLTTRWRTKPAGLIESCTQRVGAPPHTSGRLGRKNVAGDCAPRPPLGLRCPPPPLWLRRCVLFVCYSTIA